MHKKEKKGLKNISRASVTCRTTFKQSNMHILRIPEFGRICKGKKKMAEIFRDLTKHSICQSENSNESQAGWNKENDIRMQHNKIAGNK